MCVPALVFVAIFCYGTLPGLILAFKSYSPSKGIYGSPFAEMGGFQHFFTFISLPQFWTYVYNTLVLSVTQLIIGAILPVIYALFLNEVKYKLPKRIVQTIMYAPYFISTVVVVIIMKQLLDPSMGALGRIFANFPGLASTSAMDTNGGFVASYLISAVWQGLGWWSIMYMGTLANVDPNLHDAAKIDGAGRIRRIFSVNLPSIIPLAVIMFIMAVGNVLSVGFEKILVMQSTGNLEASEVIATYVYKVSFETSPAQFDLSTAVGLFNMVVNITLLLICNFISKKVSDTSLW
jgi:putative aldouronate transport system permease protein